MIQQADNLACMAGSSIILDSISSMPWYEKRNEIAEAWGAAIYLVAHDGDDVVFTIGTTDVKVSTIDGSTTPAAGTWGE